MVWPRSRFLSNLRTGRRCPCHDQPEQLSMCNGDKLFAKALAIIALSAIAGCSQTSASNPKLVACPACGHLVSKAAPTCPQCGQPQPAKEAEDVAFHDAISNDPEVGKDVLIATECSVEDGTLTSLTLTDKWPVT